MITIKTDQEIEILCEGGKKLSRILNKIAEATKPGITENDLEKLARKLILEEGAKPSFLGFEGYPAALCISTNEEVVHGIPTNRVIKNGDIVGLDCGIWYKGLCTDMAMTVGVGEISPKAAKLIMVTRNSLESAIREMHVGKYLGDIGFAVQNYVESRGFSVVRELVGHGVGKKVHEAPQVPNYGKKSTGLELKEGMVLAVEPMVNVGTWRVKTLPDNWTFVTADGELSAHFEHTIAITKNGPLVITK